MTTEPRSWSKPWRAAARAVVVMSSGALATACAFEESKPLPDGPGEAAVSALSGRWCPPAGEGLVVDPAGAAATREVDGHTLAVRWAFGPTRLEVERTIDGARFERQVWELDADAALVARTIETPALGEAELAVALAHPLDDLQALGPTTGWDHALVAEGEACDRLPYAYGHGYPEAEGWYVAGRADVAGVAGEAVAVGWYGHGGDGAGAPFAPTRSRVITIRYDDAERMVEERLDRGAADGGPHDLLRERSYTLEGRLVADRIERWSPTPKEDVVRVLRFADEGASLVRRELVDTYESALEVRWIPRPL